MLQNILPNVGNDPKLGAGVAAAEATGAADAATGVPNVKVLVVVGAKNAIETM